LAAPEDKVPNPFGPITRVLGNGFGRRTPRHKTPVPCR
jgi:hypothetical protein